MSTLLIKNIHQLVTCDDKDRVLHNADLYCEDGFIKAIGHGAGHQRRRGHRRQPYARATPVWSTPITTSIRYSPAICRRCRTWSCLTG